MSNQPRFQVSKKMRTLISFLSVMCTLFILIDDAFAGGVHKYFSCEPARYAIIDGNDESTPLFHEKCQGASHSTNFYIIGCYPFQINYDEFHPDGDSLVYEGANPRARPIMTKPHSLKMWLSVPPPGGEYFMRQWPYDYNGRMAIVQSSGHCKIKYQKW